MSKGRPAIFVQIASYRDPELLPTIEDIILKAKFPHRIRFGICRQFQPDDKFDNLDKYKLDKRFRIVDVIYNKSEGVGWAREITQRMYLNENYTIQIDSHMRFIKNWDIIMIDMIQKLIRAGHKKPLLTGYMGTYIPGDNSTPNYSSPALKMIFKDYSDDGIPIFISTKIPNWQFLKCPIPAKFISGGFYFTTGEFCKEVRYDSKIFFLGEEIFMSIKAFSYGYDLFHPHKMLVWHYYQRKTASRNWTDNKNWVLRSKRSANYVIDFLYGNYNDSTLVKKYELGHERTLRDYRKLFLAEM